MGHQRGLHDVSNFTLATGSISTEDTEGATIRFGKIRLKRGVISLNAGQGPCHAILYAGFEQIREPLKFRWIRGFSVISGDADALIWHGDLLTPDPSSIFARVQNDTASTVTVNLGYWGESV